jgi:DNA-binding transcriptional regulator YhcF (GntR family)
VRIRLDPASRTPLSAQLREAIVARVVSGRLAPGERLPPVRDLAAGLAVAPNTVAKAYRELEAAGYLVGRGRRGTFVADAFPRPPEGAEAALAVDARSFAKRARQLGVPSRRAAEIVGRALRAPRDR